MDDYYMWKNNDVALIVALTPENKIVLERQYKHAVNDFAVELPAGFSNDGENTIETAERELLEETGYRGEDIVLLSSLANNPTKEMGRTDVYMVRNAKKVSNTNWDEDEDIEVSETEIKDVLKMIYEGKIWTSGTIAAVFLALNKIGYKI